MTTIKNTALNSMTASSPQPSHPKYRSDIDGLRAVAVLSVVGFHAFPTWLTGGFIGVDVFFVISGYLISMIIFENLARGSFSFSAFYARRIKRIFPALTIVLMTCLTFGWFVLLPDELNQLGKHVAAGAGFVSNLVLWGEAGYFDNAAETKPLLHLWSLGIEEQFYIVWPLLLWLAWKRKFNPLVLVLFIACASFILNVNGVRQNPVATFYSPLTRFWELLFGTLLAWFSNEKPMVPASLKNFIANSVPGAFFTDKQREIVQILRNASAFSGFFLLAYGLWGIDKAVPFPGYWALLPVLATVMIIMAGPQAFLNDKVLSNKVLVWFGLISFPLYLWHWPILSFARIINSELALPGFRVLAVALSVLFAWLTMQYVERPVRFGSGRSAGKVAAFSSVVFALAVTGLYASKADFSASHTFDQLLVHRDSKDTIGISAAWFRGKDDWLFLGNAFDNCVAKLKLSILPDASVVAGTRDSLAALAQVASNYKTQVVLIVGPNKTSVYPEYLPDGLIPSPKTYISFFLDELQGIPNLTVHDPTREMLASKRSVGNLYWMTDTHWNAKGAYLAYAGFLKKFRIPVPDVEFKRGSTHSGDLIMISGLNDFPLHAEDNWDVVWSKQPRWQETPIPNEPMTDFGRATIVTNEKPLSNKRVWVIGDSFGNSLRQYFNATFKRVRYVGHWGLKFNGLSEELVNADKKPDLIVIVRVERSF